MSYDSERLDHFSSLFVVIIFKLKYVLVIEYFRENIVFIRLALAHTQTIQSSTGYVFRDVCSILDLLSCR